MQLFLLEVCMAWHFSIHTARPFLLTKSSSKWIPPWQSSARTKQTGSRFPVFSYKDAKSYGGTMLRLDEKGLGRKGNSRLSIWAETPLFLFRQNSNSQQFHNHNTAIPTSSAQVLGARTLFLFDQPIMKIRFHILLQEARLSIEIKGKKEITTISSAPPTLTHSVSLVV